MPRSAIAAWSFAFALGCTAFSAPVVAQPTYVDDFPAALSLYRTGGWQWPFSDGTGGTVTPTADNASIYLDGTYNAMAYAIRKEPEFWDFSFEMNFTVAARDGTPGDQLVIFLRWNNTVFPDPVNFTYPSADGGVLFDFFYGEGRLFARDANGTQLATRAYDLSMGGQHMARFDLAGGLARVSVDGVGAMELPFASGPSGLVGVMAYRVDVLLDTIRIEAYGTNRAGAPSDIVLVSLVVFAIGSMAGVAVLTAILVARQPRHRKPQP